MAVGDLVLKEVCRRVRDHLRFSDIATRYGGDEFAIILPETDLEAAGTVAARLQSAVCREPVAAGDLTLPVSLSIGGAAFPADGIASLCHKHTTHTKMQSKRYYCKGRNLLRPKGGRDKSRPNNCCLSTATWYHTELRSNE